MLGGVKAGSPLQRLPGPHCASVVQEMVAFWLHVPGAKLARPRRSMVLRRLEPNWEKSQVRPSVPPKSAWQEVQASEAPSRAVLVTSPCRVVWPLSSSASKGGMGRLAPAASRAEVEKRIFPSRISGGRRSLPGAIEDTTASTSGMHSSPPAQSVRVLHAVMGAFWQRKPGALAATATTLRAR